MELGRSVSRVAECHSNPSTSYALPSPPSRVTLSTSRWHRQQCNRRVSQVVRAMQLEDDEEEELLIPPELAVRTIPTPRLSPQEVCGSGSGS